MYRNAYNTTNNKNELTHDKDEHQHATCASKKSNKRHLFSRHEFLMDEKQDFCFVFCSQIYLCCTSDNQRRSDPIHTKR